MGLIPDKKELFCEDESWFCPKVSKRRCFYSECDVKVMRWVEKNRQMNEQVKEGRETTKMELEDVKIREKPTLIHS